MIVGSYSISYHRIFERVRCVVLCETWKILWYWISSSICYSVKYSFK